MAETDASHLLLLIEHADGRAVREPVQVEVLGGGLYRLRYSPGFVRGIAAGDEFRLVDGEEGAFEVVRRAGNVAVQVYCAEPVAACRAELAALAAAAGGVLDGGIERGLVFTFPVSVGFGAIERVFDSWVRSHVGWEWQYGNVYDPVDRVTPLNWWVGGS
jgi:hypothetical protein